MIYFIDRALSTFDTGKREAYQKGMQDVNELRKKMFPNYASIAALAREQQIELIRGIETSEFFELLRTQGRCMTVFGATYKLTSGGGASERNNRFWRRIQLSAGRRHLSCAC